MGKFCTNCGSKLDNDATFCTECGVAYSSSYKGDTSGKSRFNKQLLLPAIGLALSNSAPLVGLIISIIAFKKSPKYEGNGRKIALAGIYSASIWILMFIVYIILFIIKIRKDLGY